ncbi:hypothetical protein FRC03_006021 [Tulasnella sp. 419]|nr:hypothetical protein FRC02_009302 [Tulasnella sp. 418]KAG8960902.1 hypothetical protein FRC03_006021 [Tulasnella sp. 419]
MDDSPDPSAQFFPDVPLEEIDLYAVLNLTKEASASDIKSAYRKLALVHHPDKHSNATPEKQAAASEKFQQIGFAYAVLSDEKRKGRYDRTGRTDEGGGIDPGEGGWEAYFEELFDTVTRAKLDEMKKEYQGSEEEVNDLKNAYTQSKGSLEAIMSEIQHSTYEDEARFAEIINGLIAKGELKKFPRWERDLKDTKGKESRKKAALKEAAQAEQHAKDLGVWDEFYGSGKEGPRKTKGKGKGDAAPADDGEAALQALILKRQQSRAGAFDSLLAKYGAADAEEDANGKNSKKKKRGKAAEEEEEVERPSKRSKVASAGGGSRRTGKKGSKAR